jgi:RNA polymerase sigma factor (sigma-70 family)
MPIFRNDPNLLERFRAGDRSALEQVYWAFQAKIQRILSRGFMVGSARVGGLSARAGDLADLVQEVFVKAFAPHARASFDHTRDYAPYIYAIARNVLSDWQRRSGREILLEDRELMVAAEGIEGEADDAPWSDPSTVALVERYLAGLSPLLRAVHEQRYLLGVSQSTAAERLKMSRQQIRTHEIRLKQGLAEALASSELSPCPSPALMTPTHEVGSRGLKT